MASQQVKILTFHFMQTLLNTPYIAFTIAIYIIFLFVKESQAVLINKYHVRFLIDLFCYIHIYTNS